MIVLYCCCRCCYVLPPLWSVFAPNQLRIELCESVLICLSKKTFLLPCFPSRLLPFFLNFLSFFNFSFSSSFHHGLPPADLFLCFTHFLPPSFISLFTFFSYFPSSFPKFAFLLFFFHVLYSFYYAILHSWPLLSFSSISLIPLPLHLPLFLMKSRFYAPSCSSSLPAFYLDSPTFQVVQSRTGVVSHFTVIFIYELEYDIISNSFQILF